MAGVVITDGIRQSLAQKIAGFKIPDARVNEIAKAIISTDVKHARLDICAYGICIDYLLERPQIDAFVKIPGLRRIEVFPYGIPVPDIFRAHIEVEVPELTGRVRG